jgi:hypothetical protein
MKTHRYSLSIIILFTLAFFAVAPAQAQFGGLLKKAKEKTKQVNASADTNTNTSATSTSNTSNNGGAPASASSRNNGMQDDESLRWDLALKNPDFTNSVDEAKMRRMVEGGVNSGQGNGGFIVFSNKPITKPSATLDDTMWTLKSSDPIYMTAFLNQPLDTSYSNNMLTLSGIIVTVGDTQAARGGMIRNTIYTVYRGGGKNGDKTLALDFLPAGGKSAKFQSNVGDIAGSLRQLPPGIHIVQLLLNGSGNIGVGAFYYDNRAGQGGGGAIDATLKSVTMPAPAMRNPQLEKEIAHYLESMGGGSESRVLKVVIVDRGWTPVRNDYGVVVGRAIGAVVAVKQGDGTCWRETHTYVTNTNGSGLRLDGTRERMDMACENAQR